MINEIQFQKVMGNIKQESGSPNSTWFCAYYWLGWGIEVLQW